MSFKPKGRFKFKAVETWISSIAKTNGLVKTHSKGSYQGKCPFCKEERFQMHPDDGECICGACKWNKGKHRGSLYELLSKCAGKI